MGKDAERGKDAEWVRVGTVAAAHGLRGEVKVVSFTEDAADIAGYGPLFDETGGGRLDVESLRPVKNSLIVRFRGISDRTAAERLKGRALCVLRSVLPETDGEDDFYRSDLIGLDVEASEGRTLGRIVAVDDFGAGTLLLVRWRDGGREDYVPFTRAAVPVIDLAAGKVVLEPEALGGIESPAQSRDAGPDRDGEEKA